jgi:acyl-homoserine-lactone acylase
MYGIPDVLTAEWGEKQPDGTIKITGGDGYIVFAKFGANGLPYIESVNMYGASTNPNSPHFKDQVPLYVKQQTKIMTLDKKEVLAKAKSVYSPGAKWDEKE